MEGKKRQRAPNFTATESMYMCDLLEKYKHIIENKKTDGATVLEKQNAWKALTDEYNSNTSHVARTSENLISAYKNLKTKAKRQHSNEKMIISSTYVNSKKICEAVVQSVEANGKDWKMVSAEMNLPPDECQSAFDIIVKEAKKSESEYKKIINGTGGGPPPPPPNDQLFEKVKGLIGPSLEGMYSIYDCDAGFMKQQQDLLPSSKQTKPIDLRDEVVSSGFKEETISPQLKHGMRLKTLKKSLDPALEASGSGFNKVGKSKRKNVVDSFIKLSEVKNELVEMQMKIAEEQLSHQRQLQELEIQQLKRKIEFDNQKRELELAFIKEKYELELSLLRSKQTNM